jgi:hypothetical protein
MRRIVLLASLLVIGCVLVGLGIRFATVRLDDADKWGSVVAALTALVGLPIAGYAPRCRTSSTIGRES